MPSHVASRRMLGSPYLLIFVLLLGQVPVSAARLTPREKTYLRAMAELGEGPYRTGDIADKLGIKTTTLAPVRQLAADLDVNLNTVATAYRVLQGEGLITVRHGSGAVIASRRTAEPNREDWRKTLRAALAQMVLAGLPRAEILQEVTAELRALKAK